MSLGARDAGAYRRLVAPYLGHWDTLAQDFLRTPWDGLPRDPYRWMRFGLDALQPASLLSRRFRGAKARGLLAGLAAHAIAPTNGLATGGIALLFALAAHEKGWPVPRGGSQAISDALASYLREQGGTIRTGTEVKRLDELPPARAYVFDTSPTALARIAGLGNAYRGYRYGAACFKIDYALSGPVPWTAEEARRAGTVHIGPTAGEIDASLTAAVTGRDPSVPFLITAQPSLVDPSRAPEGRHVFWAYGHVPSGWEGDATDVIERQLERFAPGFRDLVLARAVAGPPSSRRATPTTSAATSAAARSPVSRRCSGPSSPGCRTRRRIRRCSCAPRPRRPAPGCTACRATTRRRRSGGVCGRPEGRAGHDGRHAYTRGRHHHPGPG